MTWASFGYFALDALHSARKSSRRTFLPPAKCVWRMDHACPGVKPCGNSESADGDLSCEIFTVGSGAVGSGTSSDEVLVSGLVEKAAWWKLIGLCCTEMDVL